MSACVALSNARCFSTQFAEIVKFGTANSSSLYDVDMIDDRCVQGKNSLYANSEAGFANGNCFSGATVFARNHYAFKCLKPLFGLRFLNSNVNAHGVTRLKLGDVAAQLRIFHIV